MRSSTTSDLVVFAPVMPSLNRPVICELISRTRRLVCTRRFWKNAAAAKVSGTKISTRSERRALMISIITMAPTRYVRFQTPSIRLQDTSPPMREVSLMTREWI